MNNARISLCFILAGCVFSAYPGSTYYVDYSAGSDSNNGTSTATPWKHCPGDSNATGKAAITLTPGSTVIFKGGVTYIGGSNTIVWSGKTYIQKIVVGSSGTSGNPITYDGNFSGNWGTGKAILSGNGINNGVGFSIFSQSYVTIQNFEICYFGNYTAAQLSQYNCTTNPLPTANGIGVSLTNVSHITIQNCYFHEIGIWQNTAPVQGDVDVSGEGISLSSGNNITITENEFTKMSSPVSMFTYNSTPMSISQVNVSYNNFHDYIRWCISGGVAGNNATFQDINIFGNLIHDFLEYGHKSATLCGLPPHLDGIILYVGGALPNMFQNNTLGTPLHPVKIYNNTFYEDNIIDSGNNGSNCLLFLCSWGGTTYVYNNTFVNSLGGNGCIYVQDGLKDSDLNPPVDYHFWNNTFYDKTTAISLRSMTPGYELNRPGYQIDIRNNLMYSANTTLNSPGLVVMNCDNCIDNITFSFPSLPTMMDYNLYYVTPNNPYQTGSSTPVFIATANNFKYFVYYSFANIFSTFGFEQHGHYGDPKLVDTSYGLGLNSSLNNLNLQASSPAINAGVSLISYFDSDIVGTPRPPPNRHSIGSGWDIGAYEFQNTGIYKIPLPAAPVEFALRAHPNPFRGVVMVAFDVPMIRGVSPKNTVEIDIYDLRGVLIAQLAKGAYRAGSYLVPWNASALGQSVYIILMKASNFKTQLKLIRVGK
jgi:hypothetical protein